MSFGNATHLSIAPLSKIDHEWIRPVLITYRDPNGATRTWESVERTTRPPGGKLDGVAVFAMLNYPDRPAEIVLQKQYRAPLDMITVEMPSGLLDEGETPEEAAVRELREETGYVGTISNRSFVMFNDPGFAKTNVQVFHVNIDPALPENQPQNLQPKLEEDEFIEPFRVPVCDLWSECQRLEKEGYAIDTLVGTLAEGLHMAQSFPNFGSQ